MRKKGVSIMVGYVLLITTAVVMGAIIYSWMVTYVPYDSKVCPNDVSIFVKEYSCELGSVNQLNITLQNNGKFNIAGFFAYISDDATREIANVDLASYLDWGGTAAGSAILFVARSDNSLKPNDEKFVSFNLSGIGVSSIEFMEIIPMRYQEINNRLEFVTCGQSKVKEIINCG